MVDEAPAPPQQDLVGLSMLYSYEYLRRHGGLLKRAENAAARGADVIVDSGAYTVFRKGGDKVVINVDEYADFVKWATWARFCIALDVVGQIDGSLANLERMRQRGADPAPVLLFTQPVVAAAEMLAGSDHKTICLAGGTGHAGEKEPWYRSRMRATRELLGKDAWLHALGYGRGVAQIVTLGANSTDTASAGLSNRYATVLLYDHRSMSIKAIKGGRSEVSRKPTPAELTLLTEHGIKWSDMISPQATNMSSPLIIASFVAHMKMARIVRAVAGIRYHCAVTNACNADLAVAAFLAETAGPQRYTTVDSGRGK